MEILKEVEQNALVIRQNPPSGGSFMELEGSSPEIHLPMDRPMYTPRLQGIIADLNLKTGTLDESEALYNLRVIDRSKLIHQILAFLENQTQGTLGELVSKFPLQEGLAEVVSYLDLIPQGWYMEINEMEKESLTWKDAFGRQRRLTLAQVLFKRKT